MNSFAKYFFCLLFSCFFFFFLINSVKLEKCIGSYAKKKNYKRVLNKKEVINLDEACKIAISSNPAMNKIFFRVKQAHERSIQIKSQYLPSISLECVLGYNNNGKIKDYQMGLKTSWILFDGFRHKFEDIIFDYNERMENASFDNTKKLLMLAISKAFYSVQFFREKISIAMSDEAIIFCKLRKAEIKYSNGVGHLYKIINLKIKLNYARMHLENEKIKYKIAVFNLASLLGIGTKSFFSLVMIDSFNFETIEELGRPSLKYCFAVAFEKRFDINKNKLAFEQASVYINSVISSYFPKIFFSLSSGVKKVKILNVFEDNIYNDFKINLSYDIFTGGLNTSKIMEAKERELELKNELDSVFTYVSFEIKESILKIYNAQIVVDIQRRNLELLEQTRNLIEKEYKNNFSPLIRLNEMESKLIKFKKELSIAIIDLRQAWVKLKNVIGEKIY